MSDRQTWIQVTVSCEDETTGAVSNFFMESGSSGVEEGDGFVRGFYPENRLSSRLRETIGHYLNAIRDLGHTPGEPVFEPVPDRDWSEGWRDFFKPIRVTPNLIVKPPWEKWTERAGPIVIDIDPKMAFGTGTHETTRLCLIELEKAVTPGCTVLDVGAGSGVLSIAAAKLGASSVTGIEIDEVAVGNALENVRVNGVTSKVEMRAGSLDRAGSEVFDLIVANINRKVLTGLLPDLKSHCLSGSGLILSGILFENRGPMEMVIRRSGFVVTGCRQMGEWVCFLCCLNQC